MQVLDSAPDLLSQNPRSERESAFLSSGSNVPCYQTSLGSSDLRESKPLYALHP